MVDTGTGISNSVTTLKVQQKLHRYKWDMNTYETGKCHGIACSVISHEKTIIENFLYILKHSLQ